MPNNDTPIMPTMEQIRGTFTELNKRESGTHARLVSHPANGVDVAMIRKKLDLSQAEFAELFGFNLRTLQGLESGRSKPTAAVAKFLRMIDTAPNRMQKIAQEAHHAA